MWGDCFTLWRERASLLAIAGELRLQSILSLAKFQLGGAKVRRSEFMGVQMKRDKHGLLVPGPDQLLWDWET